MDTIEREHASSELDAVAARLRVDEIDLLRALAKANLAGIVQREMTTIVGVSQPTISRLLRKIAVNPDVLKPTPTEIVDRRAAGMTTSEEMMSTLLNWPYTFGRVPESGGTSTDAYEAGSWDEIERAYYGHHLSDDELAQLMARHQDALTRAATT